MHRSLPICLILLYINQLFLKLTINKTNFTLDFFTMEDRKEENEAEIQEHGPGHWFSNWERQCFTEADQGEPSEEEVDQNRKKLWHMFQNSATAVAQLYKGLLRLFASSEYFASCALFCSLSVFLRISGHMIWD